MPSLGRKTALAPWRDRLADPAARAALTDALAPMLGPEVTARLPVAFAFDQTCGDIDCWIDTVDEMAEVQTITRTDTGAVAGLLLVFSEPGDTSDLMIGYFLGREHWGEGLASDMLAALVDRLDHGPPRKLFAGTDRDNRASRRVLEKAGFMRDPLQEVPGRIAFTRPVGGKIGMG